MRQITEICAGASLGAALILIVKAMWVRKVTRTEIFNHASAIVSRMSDAGFRFYEPANFSEVPALWEAIGKRYEHPMTSLERNDFTLAQAFWLFLMKGDQPVAGIGAKLEDLRDEAFGSYIRRVSRHQYRTSGEAVKWVAPPIDRAFSGRLIYFGGIEVHPDFRGKSGLISDFSQMARLLGATAWDFDWMYTIISYRHRKIADRYGFELRFRNAISWHQPPPEGRSDDQMVLATSREYFSHLLRTVEPGEL
jgi:hypothetical protein